MYLKVKYFLAAIVFVVVSCQKGPIVPIHSTINLNGTWLFALDTGKVGISEKWYGRTLTDSVILPGTLDENRKGLMNINRNETMRLSRELMYAGMAWYQRTITIPENWKGQYIRLMMERTKPTQVWIDNTLIGSSNDIMTPQYYNLSDHLLP